jgi:3-isopropylmalate/(R)-2-methylmalate dehydratase small subunit
MATPFTTLRARAVHLPMNDVDTDQIIPARFLTGTVRTGLGAHLFADLRSDTTGSPREGFPLNAPGAAGAQILLAGKNFGCGSSREHAAWALADFGFRAVIAPSFADIFRGNALKNNILPVQLDAETTEAIASIITRDPSTLITVSLEDQQVQWAEQAVKFSIEPFARQCLLHGVDELGYILRFLGEIETFERRRDAEVPA